MTCIFKATVQGYAISGDCSYEVTADYKATLTISNFNPPNLDASFNEDCLSESVTEFGTLDWADGGICGDGKLETEYGEVCDNGLINITAGDVCDDNNAVGGDGCSADCLSDETCGNRIKDPGEGCDDGARVDGDGCDASCQCVVTDPDACDGVDNNCNGIVDEGCPDSITLGPDSLHTLFGNLTGGSAYTDYCGAGEALIGLTGRKGGNIDRIAGRCGVLSVSADHSVKVSPGTALPDRGEGTTQSFSISCPEDNLVIGMEGRAGSGGVSDITLNCAPLLITGNMGSYALAYGPVTAVSVEGSNSYAIFSDVLIEPSVAGALQCRAGMWVDAVGIGERTPMLVVK